MKTEIIEVSYPTHKTPFAVHARREILSDIVRERGLYSTGDLEVYDLLLSPGDFFIDGGANIGWYSMYAAKRVGADGLVVAIEPDPDNVEILKENIALSKVPQVTVLEAALSHEKGVERLFKSVTNFGDHSFFGAQGAALEHMLVQTSTLADLIYRYKRVPRLIKLDIQGAEPQALLGLGAAARPGASDRPYLLCEFAPGYIVRAGNSPLEVLAFIERNAYFPYRIRDAAAPAERMQRVSLDELLELYKLERAGEGFYELLLVPHERLPEWESLLEKRSV